MITIVLNGEEKQLDQACTIEQLLESSGLGGKRLAVEVNEQIVPRGQFNQRLLNDQDKVEIVQAIGGGSCQTG